MDNRIASILNAMRRRCYNKNCKEYKNYGARGIQVCDEWRDPCNGLLKFTEWAIKNGYSDDLTIDRIDNNKGYFPNNCRWVTRKVQSNNKSNNHYVTYKGCTKTLKRWCEDLDLNYRSVKTRLNNCGWTVEQAFENVGNTRLRMIEYRGETKTLKQWCSYLGLNYTTVHSRLNKLGWSVERAFEGR